MNSFKSGWYLTHLYITHRLITKFKLILSSVGIGGEFWSVNNTSINESSELNVFENMFFLVEISNDQIIYLEEMCSRLSNFVGNHC